MTTAMTAILKQFQLAPPPAFVKVIEEICVTCGGAHLYYQCLVIGGNTFPERRDNVQGYIVAAAVNYNQGNFDYRPPGVANQIRPPGFAQPNVQNNQNRFSQPQGYNRAVIPKKLPEKLGDPRKFLIPCGFSELNCKVLANLGKFTFLADFVIVYYESDLRVPLILGRPFLQTSRAFIDVRGEEMILRDGDERLTLNMRHDTSIYYNQPQKESINMINIYDDSSKNFLKDFTTSTSPNHLLEEFADELALITFPLKYDDDLPFDIESDLKEIEYLLNHDPIKEMDFILNDLIDQNNLADLNDNLVDTMPEMFTDEHALDFSSPLL
nr:hypothetical protein [Tanacetum cinerariifolium]